MRETSRAGASPVREEGRWDEDERRRRSTPPQRKGTSGAVASGGGDGTPRKRMSSDSNQFEGVRLGIEGSEVRVSPIPFGIGLSEF